MICIIDWLLAQPSKPNGDVDTDVSLASAWRLAIVFEVVPRCWVEPMVMKLAVARPDLGCGMVKTLPNVPHSFHLISGHLPLSQWKPCSMMDTAAANGTDAKSCKL